MNDVIINLNNLNESFVYQSTKHGEFSLRRKDLNYHSVLPPSFACKCINLEIFHPFISTAINRFAMQDVIFSDE